MADKKETTAPKKRSVSECCGTEAIFHKGYADWLAIADCIEAVTTWYTCVKCGNHCAVIYIPVEPAPSEKARIKLPQEIDWSTPCPTKCDIDKPRLCTIFLLEAEANRQHLEIVREIFEELESDCPHNERHDKGQCVLCFEALKSKYLGR